MMEFSNQVQRKYNTTVLAIRSDNGTEFKNYTLDDFLGEEGIQHQYSSPYTPQQNGVAERKNRTLIEAARTMMMEYKSNYNFWVEAISTACHATNRLYFRKGLEKTPYEILTGNKPNVSYFKVFGCKCYVLVKDTRLSKFDSRAQEGIFVGYATDSHAYRVFNKSNGRVVESCDVTFDEDDRSLEERSASLSGKDQVPPKWSYLHHKAKLLPLIIQVQANLYNNLMINFNNNLNNPVQAYLNQLKNNINNYRKLIYHNNQYQKQNCVSVSTAEAEYVAAASSCAQMLWMRQTLRDDGLEYSKVPLLCDNESAIKIAYNPVLHGKMKHIEIRNHFIRDHIARGDIVLSFIGTKEQLADIFTKPLDEKRFIELRHELNIIDPSNFA
ncbi:hypothetical protein QYE76_006516 [Lolium multiflorum]|uniref:Integrase catalytic domain-containing protein n=1 Tax=Lolium multiflorum TaxID=4521 RepID=A0AAD8RYC2_LOLMU|nr:hypothetical protein QYE76_006516 [Lolium multiflorum]